jgi:hypothetical protein
MIARRNPITTIGSFVRKQHLLGVTFLHQKDGKVIRELSDSR